MIARIRTMAADEAVARLARNVSYLFSSNAAVAVLGLATLAISARTLGPAGLGVFAIIEAYVRAVERVCRPEPWQAVIRYGAQALEGSRPEDFSQLVKLGTIVDVSGALLATAAAVIGALALGPWLGIDKAHADLAALCALMLLASISATPTGVLRLFDRFGALSTIAVVAALIRLLLTVLVWWMGGGVAAFVVVLMISHAFETLSTFALAWRELGRRGYGRALRAPLGGVLAHNHGIVRFFVNSNIIVVARQSTQRFDTLIVGALTDAASVGFYQLAKRIGLAMLRLGRPLQQAVYPDIARLWARGESARFRRLVLGVAGAMGVTALVIVSLVALRMEFFAALFFGEAFAPAAPMMTIQAYAVAAFLGGVALGPALLSVGADKALAVLTTAAAVAFFATMPLLVMAAGAAGANASHLVFNIVMVGGMLALVLRRTRPTRAPTAANPPPPPVSCD